MPKKNPKHNSLRVQTKNQVTASGIYIPGGPFPRVPGWKSPQQRAQSLRTQRKHLDILYDIEARIAAVYAGCPELDDAQVLEALYALSHAYACGDAGLPVLPSLACQIFKSVQQALAGRVAVSSSSRECPNPIIDSLKCVIDSAEFWDRQGGPRGYLEYMCQFI